MIVASFHSGCLSNSSKRRVFSCSALMTSSRPSIRRRGRPIRALFETRTRLPEARLQRHQPEPLRGPHDPVIEHPLKEVDVAVVLLDGGGDARLAAVPPARPLAVLVDRDALGECLALADPDLGEAVDDQVIDLGRQTVDLEPQVVDRGPVLRAPEVELDAVRRVALGHLAGADLRDLPLDPLPSRARHVRAIEEPLEREDVGGTAVGGLDQHSSGAASGLTGR
jgi:hypothetical protein